MIRLQNLFIGICSLFVICVLCIGVSPVFAQDNAKLASLTKQIIEAKNYNETHLAFEDLADLYFKENKYNEFVDFLNSLSKQNKDHQALINYYIGLTRYNQLKYLEEKQDWDEYFAKGNDYRGQIQVSLEKAINSSSNDSPLSLYTRVIIWKFHKDQEDSFYEGALASLLNSAVEYAKLTKNLQPLKTVADELFSYKELAGAKAIYKIYTRELLSSNTNNEELKRIAESFHKEGNLVLAENIYDIYLERLLKQETKEDFKPVLIEIAKSFSYSAASGFSDPIFAEKVFKIIEDIGGQDAFNEELIFLRAFNLEKTKEYQLALALYVDLIGRYPKSAIIDEVKFKTAIIYAYILGDIKNGRLYFEGLSTKETLSPQVIASLYHLGLLSQWENDSQKAKDYYDKLIERHKDNFKEIFALVQERLKEIQETKPLEYNLRTFLDLTFNQKKPSPQEERIDLRAFPYRPKKNSEVNIQATSYLSASGCMQVELQYLWSGETGNTQLSSFAPTFLTQYADSGTKIVYLVVVSPSGVVGTAVEIISVD
ncbi:MAG: tetratricopeptide repeat protein [Candidatus Omnitrophota bacterium]